MTLVVDYGAGNLHSVCKALDVNGIEYYLSGTPEEIAKAEKIILPGVGHFGPMMVRLKETGMLDALIERVNSDVPLLGICLGMQALFDRSEEAPGVPGLGLVEGEIRRFRGDLRVPHMGWNTVEISRGASDWFYFAHSYFAEIGPATAGTTDYGAPFTSVVRSGTVTGYQFHPEKSGAAGLRLLKEWCEDAG